jgi:phospholipase/lecithinase/hemolysin
MRRICHSAACIAILLMIGAPAAAEQRTRMVERLYVFGDSYSDGGNGYALTRKPQTPPYASRYSNGMTAVEYMARTFGIVLRYSQDKSLSADASLNFAVSGAWTSSKNNDPAMDGRTGLLSQVGDFEERVRSRKVRFAADQTLFFVAIGTNDVLFGTIGGEDKTTLVASALRNVETAIRKLHATGARYIAVAAIPMVQLTPRGIALPPPRAKAVGDAVQSLNEGYRQLAGKLRTELNANIFVLPWGRYYDELMANSSAFGIANAASCMMGIVVCPDPQHFVFFDPLHPSTAAHRVVGHRLATQNRPHLICPDGLQMGAASERPVCRFVANGQGTGNVSGPMTRPNEPATRADTQAAKPSCTRVAFRQTADMCNNCTVPPWNGDIVRATGEAWKLTYVDGRGNSGSVQWRLRSMSESEIVFHDDKRDLYTRFDLTAGKGFQRRGTAGTWNAMSDVLATDCR